MTHLIRYEPLRSLRREFDRLFDNIYPTPFDEDTKAVWAPRLDFVEKDDTFITWADLPGVKMEDIDVRVQDGQLTIRGERKQSFNEATDNFHRMERAYGSFFRSFALPRSADPDGIEAAFEDGVLTVKIPKVVQSQPRQIKVGEKNALLGEEMEKELSLN